MPNLGCVALQTPSISMDSISLTNRRTRCRNTSAFLYSKVYLLPKPVEIIRLGLGRIKIETLFQSLGFVFC